MLVLAMEFSRGGTALHAGLRRRCDAPGKRNRGWPDFFEARTPGIHLPLGHNLEEPSSQ